MGRISLPNAGEWENLLGRIFYWVAAIWGVISIILTFFKAKKQHSVNIEHQLKSKKKKKIKISMTSVYKEYEIKI